MRGKFKPGALARAHYSAAHSKKELTPRIEIPAGPAGRGYSLAHDEHTNSKENERRRKQIERRKAKEKKHDV